MNLKNGFTALNVWPTHQNLPVEPTWPQQGWIQDIRTVGGRHHNDAFVSSKPVHFNQQLVQGLFAFIMTAAHAGTTLATDRIDFIDEDDGRRILFGLIKKITHARSTDPDEHFNEV